MPTAEGPELTGYAGRLSVAPGEAVSFHISTEAPSVEVRIVRLIHGDTNPRGPGHKEIAVDAAVEGRYPGRVQKAHAGSFGLVEDTDGLLHHGALTIATIIQPTTPSAGRDQGIVSLWSDSAGVALYLDERGVVAFRAGGESLSARDLPVHARRWYLVAGGFDNDAGTAMVFVQPIGRLVSAPPVSLKRELSDPVPCDVSAPLLLGALARPTWSAAPEEVTGHFNGKLEAPRLFSRLLSDPELTRLLDSPGADSAALAHWDGSVSLSRARLHETVSGRHARLVNRPARAVTGWNWSGREVNPAYAPAEYAAVHFHDDDLEDARWEPDAGWTVPDDAVSGIYAARLDADGRTDYLPFVVRPKRGRASAKVAVLWPTMTYLAYANERLLFGALASDLASGGAEADPADHLLLTHPEWGNSLYDQHSDGSGCAYSSPWRPIPNMRPGYRFWITGSPERFNADLYIVDWLDHAGVECDYITDHDVHEEGLDLLRDYRVVITGTHPEYVSESILLGLENYLGQGGRLMYLGGNGFYWVTSLTGGAGGEIEVRRGYNGTRAWESAPGETYHASTGELGGLWRYRGRAPNTLVGVGFAAQSDSQTPAAGYRRLPASHEPEVSFMFEGVGDEEIIGGFGLMNDGASGYEIDRFDERIGTPGECWRVATSQGLHNETYLLTVEDMLFTLPVASAPECEEVRADLVYVRCGDGGEVFSTGSINWCGSLSHARYDNNVARISGNVLRHFLRD
ncbi:MAG: N,N-dimethylformamidase beta subunit family domain-containing protein [Solirubrobacteraceae bacterium]